MIEENLQTETMADFEEQFDNANPGLWHFNYIKTSTKCRNALFFCQILHFILE